MRKGLAICVIIAFILGITLAIVPSVYAVGSTVDQQNSTLGLADMILDSNSTRAQTFQPSMTHFTQADFYLKDRLAGRTLIVQLYNESTSELVNEASTRMDEGDGWQDVHFEDITLSTSQVYRLKLTTVTPLNVKWTYTGNNYNGGFLYFGVSTPDYNSDFNFKTYGYNDPASDPTTPAVNAEISPSSEASASIAKPTGLLAAYSFDANKKGVNLTWKASATIDITGYKVYRSIVKGKSYNKIGQVEKSKIEFVDPAAEASKTYYYVVRAYKGNEESASSNEASLLVPADAAPISPLNFKVISFTDSKIKVAWDKNPETNIASYTLTILKGDEQIEMVTVLSTMVENVFSNLSPDTEYKITVTASNGTTVSAPAELTQKTALATTETKASRFEMTLLTWILSGIGVLLIGLLILLIMRRRRLARKFL